ATILRAVVSEYIHTAQPVGSAHVTRDAGIGVSSATVRNDMAQLEADGYLYQPHTSAGRVPTDKGYRAFVDELTGPNLRLGKDAAARVRDFFDTTYGELEHMLKATTDLLAGLTHQAAVVVASAAPSSPVKSLQLVGLAPNVALFVAVLANGAIDKRTVELATPAADDVLARSGEILAFHLVGRPMSDIVDIPVTGEPTVDRVLAACVATQDSPDAHDADQVYVGGTAQMTESFEAIGTVRQVLSILEQQLVVVTLLRDVMDRGLQVAIGAETGIEPLADCSVVVAPYEIDGRPAGSLALLGSTRMDYPQALAAVALVSQGLGRRLTEG
ncbi:MAG: heat-inducible transcription repressor HrcA, partial [Actinobacteria bacterium]|nr:heat-inducible transcription repressor HrcA [Actinomycetota bacterium]